MYARQKQWLWLCDDVLYRPWISAGCNGRGDRPAVGVEGGRLPMAYVIISRDVVAVSLVSLKTGRPEIISPEFDFFCIVSAILQSLALIPCSL